MALVGEAHIIVRAITQGVESDIRKGFNSISPSIGKNAGDSLGQAFRRGFESSTSGNIFGRIDDGLTQLARNSDGVKTSFDSARNSFHDLTREGYFMGTSIAVAVGAISSLIGGLGAIVGAAGEAAAALAAVGGVVTSLGAGFAVGKLALGGVGRALTALSKRGAAGGGGGGGGGGGAAASRAALAQVQAAYQSLTQTVNQNKQAIVTANNEIRQAQLDLNAAFVQGQADLKQLGFDAEDAALNEKQAAPDLQKARLNLIAAQQLPPNDLGRQQAELSFQEADLAYREALSRSQDLNAEQEQAQKTGVAGTKVVIDAQNNLAAAVANRNKVVADGLRQEAIAQDRLAAAKKAAATAGGGGGGGASRAQTAAEFALSKLNDAQRKFVFFLLSLKPQLAILRKEASDAFLPPLQQAITILDKGLFPALKRGVGEIGAGLGVAVVEIAKAITAGDNVKNLAIFFKASADNLKGLGIVIGNVFRIALSVLVAVEPLTRRFITYLENKTDAIRKSLDAPGAQKELTAFFQTAGDEFAKFATIAHNVFSGFGNIIKANVGPGTGGGYLLDWLTQATKKFADLGDTASKRANLKKYFFDASVNAQKVLSSVGGLVKALLKLGANPSIGKTFDILAQGAPSMAALAKTAADAGPQLAKLVVQIVAILDKLSETGAIRIFFDTLTSFANAVTEILKNPLLNAILTVTGRFAAFLLALGLIAKLGKFAFKVVFGEVALLTGAMSKLVITTDKAALATNNLGKGVTAAGLKTTGFRSKLSGVAGFLGGPWGLAIALGVAALVALIAELDKVRATGSEIKNSLLQSKSGIDSLTLASKNLDTPFNKNLDSLAAWGNIGNTVGKQFISTSNRTKEFTNDLNSLQDMSKNTFTLFGGGKIFGVFPTEVSDTGSVVAALGTQIASLYTTNAPQAAAAFNKIAAQTDGSKTALIALLNAMPDYKQALIDQANALHINVTNGTDAENSAKLLAFAQGKIGAAAKGATQDLKDLSSALRGFGSTQEADLKATSDFKAAIHQADEALKGARKTLDQNTEAGRANQASLLSVTDATRAAEAAAVDNGASLDVVRGKYQQGRDELTKQLRVFGVTGEAAKEYIDKLLGTPAELQTQFDLDSKKAMDKLGALARAVKTLYDNSVAVANLYSSGGAYRTTSGANGALHSYANGGVAEGIYNGRAGSLYKFAEPSVGWEAFISGRPGHEKQNQALVNEAASRLGMTKSGSTTTINVYPPPGSSPSAIATAVNREISNNNMKKGSV